MHSAKCTCHVFEARAAVKLQDAAQASAPRDTTSSFICIALMRSPVCLQKSQPPPSVTRHPTFWEDKICSNAPLLSLAWNALGAHMAPGGQDALKQEARTWTVLAVGGQGPRAFSWEHSDCCLLPLQLPLGVPTPFHSSGFLPPTVYNQGWQPLQSASPQLVPGSHPPPTSGSLPPPCLVACRRYPLAHSEILWPSGCPFVSGNQVLMSSRRGLSSGS